MGKRKKNPKANPRWKPFPKNKPENGFDGLIQMSDGSIEFGQYDLTDEDRRKWNKG